VSGNEVRVDEVVVGDEYGRLRTVVEGPDGALYLLTSNRDGRGDARRGDDRILRLNPPPR
jgi:aldose sugar dehydrogenase